MFNKPTSAALCAIERRQREDSSPRLLDLVPPLRALSILIDEHSTITTPNYVRRIVVGRAPALFILPCGDLNCSDGGHDITEYVLSALKSRRHTFSGSHPCPGWIGTSHCTRTMWYSCEADYTMD